MNGELTLGISYFGKLPGRGDFLKGATNNHQLIARLDRWAGDALEQLSRDVAWKRLYDLGQPLNFAVMGSRSRAVVAGHILPSADESGRRFPFISAISMEVRQPLAFMSRSPLAFSRVWARLERASQGAHTADDPLPGLNELTENRANVNVLYESLNPAFQDFLEMQTLASLQALLTTPDQPVSTSRILLALGLLLAPVTGTGSAGMGKGLVLPLPRDPLQRNLVSCLWMDLLSGFLGRADFELLMLQRHNGPPMLAVSFKGLEGRSLHAMFDPNVVQSNYIELYDPGWVDAHVAENAGLQKLAAYAGHDDLTLRTARQTFRETFLGS